MIKNSMKNLLGAVALIAVLAVSSWLPTRFIQEGNMDPEKIEPTGSVALGQASTPATRAEKASLVSVCRISIGNKRPAPNGYAIEAFDESMLPDGMLQRLNEKISSFMELLSPDLSTDLKETGSGSDCYIFTNELGQSVKVWRFFSEWTGDWSNWLEFYADIDTEEVYYFYFSTGCERNHKIYESIGRVTDTNELANVWQKTSGHRLEEINWNGSPESAAIAVYSSGSEILSYSIECRFYQATLADYRIIMQG